MKMAPSPISSPSPIVETQRLLALQMRNLPTWGVISIKVVYHGGESRRIVVNRKTSILLEAQRNGHTD
jgi:hypothetical protein